MVTSITKHHWITTPVVPPNSVLTKLAPVAPLKTLLWLEHAGFKVDYFLLLAHDVANPVCEPGYSYLFDSNRQARRKSFVILDNSLIEMGGAVDDSIIERACRIVHPDVVVLPDVLGNPYTTFSLSVSAYYRWAAMGIQSMAVVLQGDEPAYVKSLVESFMNKRFITMWCIPRHLTKLASTRTEMVKMVHALDPSRPIHLLGFSNDLADDIASARLPGVVGIDSAVPLRAAVETGHSWAEIRNANCYFQPRGIYWDTYPNSLPVEIQNLMLDNLVTAGAALHKTDSNA